MRYIPTGQEAKDADGYTIHEIGIPAMVLMERAALQCVEIMEQKVKECSDILIVCGSGNNGGDGFAIARLLHLKGYKVTVVFLGKIESLSPETRQQMKILKNYGVSIGNTLEQREYSVIIDAIFGIGLSRDIEGEKKAVIDQLNTMQGLKMAVDIPSGIDASDGTVKGTAFSADITVTFAYSKLGMLLYPGKIYAGEVILADIGIDAAFFEHSPEAFITYDIEDIRQRMPKRKPNSHKGTYGKLLFIAGSPGMAGAAYLNAKAAYKVGAGLVHIYTPKENQIALQQLLPEAVLSTYEQVDETELKELIDWADVVGIGSGLGATAESEKIVEITCRHITKPCMIDADALNILAKMQSMDAVLREKGEYFVLTPHVKELARLLHLDIDEVKNRRLSLLRNLAAQSNCTYVAKDARTIVVRNGMHPFINTSGNAAMAKAGAGDVLTGMIAGLAAQGCSVYEAATLGVYLHGLAGDAARGQIGDYGVMAGDLAEAAAFVLHNL